ncbi:hypothetical protein VKT23_006054 [Stygiomarasmius scandens]|uniref:DUF6534 domain-containing protein n=1 Tax=Marasmiellus scandens TaxID=2682957 RepID=A0ABR1JVH2_9AGAR
MTEAQKALGIPDDIVKIAGPLALGYLLSSILYGVLVLQIYLYYIAFPNDRRIIKALVYGCFALNTAQTILNVIDAFDIFGSGFGDITALQNMRRAGISVPIMTGLISCSVQVFYGYQIYILSRSKILVGSIVATAVTQCIGALVEGVYVVKINNLFSFQRKTFIECTVWLAGSALCDIIIAVSMTIYLLRAKRGFRRTHAIIVRLIRLIIETGTATAIVALIDSILFLTIQRYPYYTLPARCLGKIYANSLMVILNSRMKVVGGRDDDNENDNDDEKNYPYDEDSMDGYTTWMTSRAGNGRRVRRSYNLGFPPTRSGSMAMAGSISVPASMPPSMASAARPSKSRNRVSYMSEASRKTGGNGTRTPVSIVAPGARQSLGSFGLEQGGRTKGSDTSLHLDLDSDSGSLKSQEIKMSSQKPVEKVEDSQLRVHLQQPTLDHEHGISVNSVVSQDSMPRTGESHESEEFSTRSLVTRR